MGIEIRFTGSATEVGPALIIQSSTILGHRVKFSYSESKPNPEAAAILNDAVKGVTKGVPAMVVLVDNYGQNFVGDAITFVPVPSGLELEMLAAIVDMDLPIAFEVRDAIFLAANPFLGRLDIESLP